MFRKRIKSAVRKAAIKFFDMEFDTEYRDPGTRKVDKVNYDPSKIPKVVDGDGDTPGANDKFHIGPSYVAAQMTGDSKIWVLDVRDIEEIAGGFLPWTQPMPGKLVEQQLTVCSN